MHFWVSWAIVSILVSHLNLDWSHCTFQPLDALQSHDFQWMINTSSWTWLTWRSLTGRILVWKYLIVDTKVVLSTHLNDGDLNFCRELSSYFNEYVKLCPSLSYMTRHYRDVVSLVVHKRPVCEGLGKRASGHPVAWWVFRPPCVEETKATLNSSSVMSLLQGRCLVLCKGI